MFLNGKFYSIDELDYLPKDLRLVDITHKKNSAAYAFFGKHHPFSNFYRCDITIEGISLKGSEHYFQYSKAHLFKDYEAADMILEAENPSEFKRLGDTVKGYTCRTEIWNTEYVNQL